MHAAETRLAVTFQPMGRAPLRGLTIKTALTVGFGLTLALWVFTGYQFAQGVADVERRSAGVASKYVQAQDLLSFLRTHVLATSGYVRDVLLDPTPRPTLTDRERIDQGLSDIRRAVTMYVPVMDSPDEHDRLGRLRTESELFATAVVGLLARDDQHDGRTQFSTAVIPRRAALVDASEQLQTFNRAAFVHYQANLAAIHNAAERQTWWRLGWALALSLSIAVLATLYAGRLETRLTSQLEKDARNTRALQQLSTQLINAQEEERRRIARELHDEVGQALTAIKVELAVAQRKIESTRASGELLDAAQAITDRTLHTVRDLSHLLHPPTLDDLGLAAAVDSYLRDFSRRFDIRANLHHEELAARLTPAIEVATYRIIQEALTNVAKHAHARTCGVTLRQDGGTFEIIVEDDGRGFDAHDVDESSRTGLGLLGMRERVSQLHGSMFLSSAAGQGTRLRFEIPVNTRHEVAATADDTSADAVLEPESANG